MDPLALVAGTNSQGEEGEESGAFYHRQPIYDEEEQEEEKEGGNPFTRHQAVAGPVRLELGMDAEVLDKILDEIEVNFRHSFSPFLLGLPSIFRHHLV